MATFFRNVVKEDFLDFNAGLGADDLNGESGSSFDISQAVGRLGLEDDADQKKHPIVNNGAYMSFLILRYLRIRDLQRKVSGMKALEQNICTKSKHSLYQCTILLQ